MNITNEQYDSNIIDNGADIFKQYFTKIISTHQNKCFTACERLI